MKNMEDAILRLVKLTLQTKAINEAMDNAGIQDTVFSHIYGELVESLYEISGEHAVTVQDSSVYKYLNVSRYLHEERIATMIYRLFDNHAEAERHTVQPRPNTIEADQFRDMVRESGGYMTPEGDWS